MKDPSVSETLSRIEQLEHRVEELTHPKSFQEVRDAISNRNPLVVCSSQGLSDLVFAGDIRKILTIKHGPNNFSHIEDLAEQRMIELEHCQEKIKYLTEQVEQAKRRMNELGEFLRKLA